MVLYRRKPVKFEPQPTSVDDGTEVWIIEQTQEAFLDYEKFLYRRDFYEQKCFACAATGRTGLTFFEAWESEVGSNYVPGESRPDATTPQTEAYNELNNILPDTLRSHVLAYVQFMTTPRMDDLVNDVFDNFKEQFEIHDRVSIEGEGSARKFGVITDIQDNALLQRICSLEEGRTALTYIITLDDNDEIVTKYKASELQRDRRVYSKLILKQFLRTTVHREPWVGAPWMVKDRLAKRYNLPSNLEEKKEREAALLAERKAAAEAAEAAAIAAAAAAAAQQRRASPPVSHPRPTVNGHTPQMNGLPPPQGAQQQAGFMSFHANPPYVYGHPHTPLPGVMHLNGLPPPYPHQLPPVYYNGVLPPPHIPPGYSPYPPAGHGPSQYNQIPAINQIPQHLRSTPFLTSFQHPQGSTLDSPQPQLSPPIPREPPVRYPTEDLEIKAPRTGTTRPALKFFSDDVPEGVEAPVGDARTGIQMKNVGPLLCSWETLNVHDTVYQLDSFTFDDFVDAMRFSSDEVECELFQEIHCSILKQLVSSTGELHVQLEKQEDEDEEGSESSEEPTPEPEEVPVRTTRGSLRRSEAQQLVKQRTPTPEPPKVIHNATDFLEDYDWEERCKLRDFQNGGWQAIIVGMLHRLSFNPVYKDSCEEVLARLLPPDEDASVQTIFDNYTALDVNLRVIVLDMLLRLTITTTYFRDQLMVAAQDMTRLRKEKIEFQRKRKDLADELFKLDLERKIHLPANTPASPTETKENDDMDISMTSLGDGRDGQDEDEENVDGNATANRRVRKSNGNKRKAAASEARKEKAKKMKADAEKTKKQKEWEKLLDSIEKKKAELKDCEDNINELDDDLREALVHRSKILGKDRFLNKYYWFEHNGMPFGGVPNSSTAEYGYANGRIWVQGPDKHELQPNLEEPALTQDSQRFGFTIPQRKEEEEGSTHLSNSTEWGYYDDPEDIAELIQWLDERGNREKQLRKELQAFRDRIAEYMGKMKAHLVKAEEMDEEDEDEEPSSRVSTRNQKNVERAAKDRCLLWTNSILMESEGHRHYDEYEPPRKAKAKGRATTKKGKR